MDDVEWNTSWGYDILHYVPILEYARKKHIRLVGLDAPTSLIDAVVNNLIDESYQYQYQSSRRARLLGHEFASLPMSCLTNAQRRTLMMEDLRDNYMAESASLHLKRHDGWIVLLAGTMHVDQRDGVPNRTLRRVARQIALNDIEQKETKDERKATSRLSDRANRGVFTLEPRLLVPGSPVQLPTSNECDLAWFVATPEGFDPNRVNLAPRPSLLQ
eukprot:13773828-Ditylum_brightwellii.AAC.1